MAINGSFAAVCYAAWIGVPLGRETNMTTRHSSKSYFFLFAGNTIRPSEAFGTRLLERRPISSSGGGSSTATWLFISVTALASLVLGVV